MSRPAGVAPGRPSQRIDHSGSGIHTHLGDAVVTQELRGTLEETRRPAPRPKHRVLRRPGIRPSSGDAPRHDTMLRTDDGFCDFRENGLKA